MNKKEMTELKPGDIIQNKKDPKWSFLVSQNFGEYLVAVRTIKIDDPTEWELASTTEAVLNKLKHQTPDETKAKLIEIGVLNEDGSLADDYKPLIEDVAKHLNNKLKKHDWFGSVGIGELDGKKTLYVYTVKKKYDDSYKVYYGYKVIYKYVGNIKPL